MTKKSTTLRAARALVLPAALFALVACGERHAEARSDTAASATSQAPASSAAPAQTPAPSAESAPKAGKPRLPVAPDFELTKIGGGTVKLSELRGKVVLLDFWATWCRPCVAGIPHLNDLYGSYQKQGFEVVGISLDQGRGKLAAADVVKNFMKGIPMTYPVALADPATLKAYGGIRSIPTAFLIDRDGNVRQSWVGLQGKEVFKLEIEQLLGVPASGGEKSL